MSDKTEGAGTGEGKGSLLLLLLPIRHPTLALADGCCAAPPAADRGTAARLVVANTGRGRAEQEGARKEKKSRGSVGPSFALVRRRPEAPLPPSKSRWAAPCVAVAAQGAALLFCTLPR